MDSNLEQSLPKEHLPIQESEPSIAKYNIVLPTGADCFLAIVENIYHATPDTGLMAITTTENVPLKSDDPWYQRQYKVGEEWKEIDVPDEYLNMSLMVIKNLEGTVRYVIPSHEEQEDINSKILLIGVHIDLTNLGLSHTLAEQIRHTTQMRKHTIELIQPMYTLFPQRTFRATPVSPRKLRLKSKGGVTKVLVTIIPG